MHTELTFGTLARTYLDSGLPRSLTGRPSYRDYAYIYQRFFECPEWRDQPLSQIHRYQVMALNQSLSAMPAHANKIIGFLKQVFSWGQRTINPATQRPFYEGVNPALQIDRHRCDERERVMDHAEIALLLQQIAYFDPKYEALYTCRLLIPCRLKELCTMRRDAVSATGKWTKGITKNGRPHTIHIVEPAMELLRQLPTYWRHPVTGEKVQSEYFFTGHYGNPLTTGAVQKQWRRHRAQLDMGDVWLLDFSRVSMHYIVGMRSVMEGGEITMAIGLRYSVPIVSYVPKALKQRASRAVQRRKRTDRLFSLSRFVEESLVQALDTMEGEPPAQQAPVRKA